MLRLLTQRDELRRLPAQPNVEPALQYEARPEMPSLTGKPPTVIPNAVKLPLSSMPSCPNIETQLHLKSSGSRGDAIIIVQQAAQF